MGGSEDAEPQGVAVTHGLGHVVLELTGCFLLLQKSGLGPEEVAAEDAPTHPALLTSHKKRPEQGQALSPS